MREIQLIVLKLIRIILIASLFPALGMLIIAAFNERVRRILLWILTPTAVLAITAYFILAPRRMGTVEDWSQGAAALKAAFQAGLPFLILLLIAGAGAYLFGPQVRDRLAAALHGYARGKYLAALIDWVEPQLEGMVRLEGRDLPQEITSHLRLAGGPGSGKSVLLRQMLHQRAFRAQADPFEPLPFWLDLDERLAGPAGLQFELLHAASPVQTRFIGWLLKREAQAKDFIFFVDGSVQTYGFTFAASGGMQAAQSTAGELAKMIQTYPHCPFIMAVPPGITDGTLNHLADREVLLPELSEEGIRAGAAAMADLKVKAPVSATQPASMIAERLNAALRSDSGIWPALAGRPAFLRWLSLFYSRQGRLPKDTRELFRVSAYPGKLPAEQVEAALISLAEQNARSGQYWAAENALEQHSSKPAGKAPAGRTKIVSGCIEAGLLRSLPADPASGRPQALIGFAHPILLAYATALAWSANRAISIEKTLSSQPAEGTAGDPVLADALVFYNSLESDPARRASMLEALTAAGGSPDDGGEGNHARWLLAAQCLLAMPPESRPRKVVERTAGQMIGVMGFDEQAAGQARRLLEPFDTAERSAIYASALGGMDERRLEQTLRRITEFGEGDGGQDFLRSMLWHADEALSRLVGQVWAGCEPRETAGLLQELYEHGPAERRGLAIDLLGSLPETAAGAYLNGLLLVESDPALRIAVLKSLAACGAMQASTLMAVLADERESDPVRVHAARELSHTGSGPLQSGGTVRELVRISRLALPEQARGYLQRVLDALRDTAPELTSRWEEVANPYLVGRPVSDARMFFGRAQILRDLRSAVDKASHVLVTGERGSGKTSLLYRAAAMLQEDAGQQIPVRTVFFDLVGLQPHEFYETAIRGIIEGLHDPNLIADPNVPRPYTDQHFERDLKDVLVYLQANSGPHSRLALLVDHVDVLVGYPPAMHAALQRILEGAAQYGLAAILAGTDPLRRQQAPEQPAAEQREDQHKDLPFYSGYLTIPLPRLTREETTRLITEPVAGMFAYEAAAVERIIQAAQGRPDAAQALCQKLVSHLLEAGTRTVTAAMVDEALRGASPRAELLSQSESALNRLMDWLEANPDAPTAHVEERLKHTWSELQKALVQQVLRARKGKG